MFSQWLKIWYSKMPTPDFQPNGAPIPKPNLPYAEPNIPNARPTGLPFGMSPLPKTEPPPSNVPIPKPGVPGQPIAKPLPKPDFGGKTAKPPRQFPTTNTPRTPGTKPFVPTIPQLVRKIIEYVLEPQPTSDGTPPDFEEVVPEDEPYPDTRNEPELETQECLELVKYPQLEGDKNSSLIQLDYLVTPGHKQTNFNSLPVPDLVIKQRKTYKKERLITLDSSNRQFTEEFRKIGKYTTPASQGPQLITYKVVIRVGFRRDGDGVFVWGGWSIYLLGPYNLAGHTGMPDPILVGDSAIKRLQYQGARYLTRFGRQAYPCSPQSDDDIQDPNDYDRQQDDKDMPCKFTPQNNTDVASLQSSTLYYQKFRGCQFHSDGLPNFFENGEMEVPNLMHPAIAKVLELHNEALASHCTAVPPIYYWGLKPGNQSTVFAGMPGVSGQEISLPVGCSEVGITFDASQAKADKNLRDLKRINSTASNENSFINVARVWIIDNQGNAIASEQIWVPSTILHIPLQHRAKSCKLRLLVKSIAVTFTVFDSGARWSLLRGQVS